MILVEHLRFSYPLQEKKLFKDLNLKVETSSWVVLIGPEGAGKTTLAKLITGLLKPDSGTVTLGTRHTASFPDVGYLGGDPYDALVGISVEEDIVFGLENLRLPVPEIRTRLNLALSWTGLSGMEQRLVHTLSGGEQQRLALASILAMGAKIVILDEAMTMLDRPARRSIRSLLQYLRSQRGLTILEITQNMDDMLQCDRLFYLSHGTIDFEGRPFDFISSTVGSKWAASCPGVTGLRIALKTRGLSPDVNASASSLLKYLINIFNK